MIDIYLVYIFENSVSGFATYKNSIHQCFKQSGYICHDIVLNSPNTDFIIESKDDMVYYKIPKCDYLNAIGTILSIYIEDRNTNVFFQQFSMSFPVMNMLKKYFPKSKLMYVIHDFIWASKLYGNIDKFKTIIDNTNLHLEYADIVNIFEDGKKTFDLVDNVVCLSQDTIKILKDIYKIDSTKLALIPNGLKDETKLYRRNNNLRNCYGISNNDKIFLFVGRLTQQKGVFILLESINKIIKYHKNVRFVFAGNYHESVLSQISETIRKYIILLGCVTKDKLYEWYMESDFGIISTYYEQCSYVGIEMKMFGLPVIASDGFGIKCMFNNLNGKTFELWNKELRPSDSLTNILLSVFSMGRTEIDMLKNKSREDFLHTYSAEKMMHSYKLLINSLLTEK